MLPLDSNRLKKYPGPPSSLEPRDWARLLHEERVQSHTNNENSYLICQFAPAEPSDSSAIEAASDGALTSRLASSLGGLNSHTLSFDGISYDISRTAECQIRFFTDGRIELLSTELESDLAGHSKLMAPWIFALVRDSARVAEHFYAAVGCEGDVFLDWTLETRIGIDVFSEPRQMTVRATTDRATYGQSLVLPATEITERLDAQINSIAHLARLESVPDSWFG